MKKQVISRISGCLGTALLVTSLHAQVQDLLAMNIKAGTVTPTSLLALARPVSTANVGVYVRAKVMYRFLETFADATNVQWSISDNNYYFASFTTKGRLCKALFTNRGGLVYSIHYGTEKDLPRDLYRMVKSAYVDFNIGAVSEVNCGEGTAWIVNLQDRDNLILVHVVDGSLEELHHYQTHF